MVPDNADLLCIQGYSDRKMGQDAKSVDIVSKGILLDPKPSGMPTGDTATSRSGITRLLSPMQKPASRSTPPTRNL